MPGSSSIGPASLVRAPGLRYRRAFTGMRAVFCPWLLPTAVGPVDVLPQEFVMAKNEAAKAKGTEHPDYHFIKVVMTDGTEYKTRSTYGKEGDVLNLDIDPSTHPAWTGGEQKMLDRGGRVSRFNSRFGGLGFGKK